jgi:UDP-3-O-[3-hydroxymyristoyl] glucosamine N-acyltransferase
MPFTAAEIARHLEGEVIGNLETSLLGFAPADHAKPGDLIFAENDDFLARAEQSAASAIVTGPTATSTTGKTLIRVANARIGFAKAVALFFPEPVRPPGIHPSAVVAPSAKIDPSAHIGPHCVIDEDVHIGPGTVLRASVFVGRACQVGAQVILAPHVTLFDRTEVGDRTRISAGTVIGADGFGYVLDAGAHRKIPQVGNVVIGADVEIGANVTIDRGALGPTVIGAGTKIDNLVQIAHNVQVGEHCIIIALTGIAGSCKLGHHTIIAGQVGLAGHLTIGNHVTVGAQSGVMHNIPDGQVWLGTPGMPEKRAKRAWLSLPKLPDLLRRVKTIEQKLGLTSLENE